jgi:type IV fimbrial biogenesis protein FimT
MHRTSGFSLVELLIALTVLGLILAIGIPGYASFRDTLAQQQARGQLIADLRYARQTSVTRHRSVVVAFGNGSVTTNIRSYTLLTDLDGDGVPDANEPIRWRNLPNRVQISSVAFTPTATRLTFDTSGLLVPGSSGGRLVIRGRRGRPDTLAVSAVGMVYQP